MREKELKNGDCDAKAFRCEKCGYEMATLRELKTHRKNSRRMGRCPLRTNQKLPRLVCAYCDLKTMRREVMQRHIARRDKKTKKCPQTWSRDVEASSLEWLLRADRKEIIVKDKLPPMDEVGEEVRRQQASA